MSMSIREFASTYGAEMFIFMIISGWIMLLCLPYLIGTQDDKKI